MIKVIDTEKIALVEKRVSQAIVVIYAEILILAFGLLYYLVKG